MARRIGPVGSGTLLGSDQVTTPYVVIQVDRPGGRAMNMLIHDIAADIEWEAELEYGSFLDPWEWYVRIA